LLTLPERELADNVVEQKVYTHACFTDDSAVLVKCSTLLLLIVEQIERQRRTVDVDVEKYVARSSHS